MKRWLKGNGIALWSPGSPWRAKGSKSGRMNKKAVLSSFGRRVLKMRVGR